MVLASAWELKREWETGTHTAQGRVGRVGRRLAHPRPLNSSLGLWPSLPEKDRSARPSPPDVRGTPTVRIPCFYLGSGGGWLFFPVSKQ